MTPDQKLVTMDLEGAAFRAGVLAGRWGPAAQETLPEGVAWPRACFWLKAAERAGAPDRYHVMIDVMGYRAVSPTGSFWDPDKKAMLEVAQYPQGKPGSRFVKVFRTDWPPGLRKAFYHPYDRFALSSHPAWPTEMPHRVWTEKNTIADYLNEFQSLLAGDDYVGR